MWKFSKKNLWSGCKSCASKIPLVDDIARARFSDIASTTKELIAVWLLSLAPLLLGSLIQSLKPKDGRFIDFLWNNLQSGEIFIYTNALLAPVIYNLYKFNEENRQYNSMLSTLVMYIAVIVTSTVMYVMHKTDSLSNMGLSSFIASTLIVVAAVIRFNTMIQTKNEMAVVEYSRTADEDFTEVAKGEVTEQL